LVLYIASAPNEDSPSLLCIKVRVTGVFGSAAFAGETRLIVSNCVVTKASVIDKLDILRISTFP
jgi:hypothetical protein